MAAVGATVFEPTRQIGTILAPMAASQPTVCTRRTARDRILDTAYELFSRHGTRAVGVDRIIAESGSAKMTLYRNFPSKDDLILAFLERRGERWTKAWLQAEVERRAETPAARLLAIFDTFAPWFCADDFEGCSFINVMLEVADADSPVRRASVEHLAAIRAYIRALAEDAGIADADGFARQWHILMKGSIVAAAEGDRDAASRAQEMGRLLLAHHGVAV
jgi:AcrR family transcriptional regulator